MSRNSKLKKNIYFSLVLTGINMGISFLLYPLLIDLLGVDVYGTWLTIASLSTWMTFFEFGLGSGLKNQLAKALSNNRIREAKELVSTAYFAICIIVFIVALIFLATCNLINWNKLLGSSLNPVVLKWFITIMISSFLLIFILKLIGNIANAYQDPFIEKLIGTSISLSYLFVVILLLYLHLNNVLIVSFWWSFSTIIVWTFFSILLYFKRYKIVRPSLKCIEKKRLNSLMGLGIQFFIIQLSLVFINGSTNFIISHYIGPAEVVTYNATYKLFSISNILYSIIIAPTWPAFIDALEKKDVFWIKLTIKRMLILWGIISLCMLAILIVSPFIFELWLDKKIIISFALSSLLYLYFTGVTFGGVFNMFVNATGHLKIQMICWICTSLIYIPLVICLIKFTNLGIFSIAIGLICTNVYYIFIAPFQYRKLITGVEVSQ